MGCHHDNSKQESDIKFVGDSLNNRSMEDPGNNVIQNLRTTTILRNVQIQQLPCLYLVINRTHHAI